VCLFNDCFD